MKDSSLQVLRLMQKNSGACGRDFTDEGIGRYGARISDLRADGYVIQRELCTRHAHNHRMWLYRVTGIPQDDGQVALAVGTGR